MDPKNMDWWSYLVLQEFCSFSWDLGHTLFDSAKNLVFGEILVFGRILRFSVVN